MKGFSQLKLFIHSNQFTKLTPKSPASTISNNVNTYNYMRHFSSIPKSKSNDTDQTKMNERLLINFNYHKHINIPFKVMKIYNNSKSYTSHETRKIYGSALALSLLAFSPLTIKYYLAINLLGQTYLYFDYFKKKKNNSKIIKEIYLLDNYKQVYLVLADKSSKLINIDDILKTNFLNNGKILDLISYENNYLLNLRDANKNIVDRYLNYDSNLINEVFLEKKTFRQWIPQSEKNKTKNLYYKNLDYQYNKPSVFLDDITQFNKDKQHYMIKTNKRRLKKLLYKELQVKPRKIFIIELENSSYIHHKNFQRNRKLNKTRIVVLKSQSKRTKNNIFQKSKTTAMSLDSTINNNISITKASNYQMINEKYSLTLIDDINDAHVKINNNDTKSKNQSVFSSFKSNNAKFFEKNKDTYTNILNIFTNIHLKNHMFNRLKRFIKDKFTGMERLNKEGFSSEFLSQVNINDDNYRFIMKNYSDNDLKLYKLKKHFGLNLFKNEERFKKLTNYTFYDFVSLLSKNQISKDVIYSKALGRNVVSTKKSFDKNAINS